MHGRAPIEGGGQVVPVNELQSQQTTSADVSLMIIIFDDKIAVVLHRNLEFAPIGCLQLILA